MCVAKDEFDAMMQHKCAFTCLNFDFYFLFCFLFSVFCFLLSFSLAAILNKRVPILVFANKSDVRGSLSGPDIAKALELEKIVEKPWHIMYLFQLCPLFLSFSL
jgi:hypothetical protein